MTDIQLTFVRLYACSKYLGDSGAKRTCSISTEFFTTTRIYVVQCVRVSYNRNVFVLQQKLALKVSYLHNDLRCELYLIYS